MDELEAQIMDNGDVNVDTKQLCIDSTDVRNEDNLIQEIDKLMHSIGETQALMKSQIPELRESNTSDIEIEQKDIMMTIDGNKSALFNCIDKYVEELVAEVKSFHDKKLSDEKSVIEGYNANVKCYKELQNELTTVSDDKSDQTMKKLHALHTKICDLQTKQYACTEQIQQQKNREKKTFREGFVDDQSIRNFCRKVIGKFFHGLENRSQDDDRNKRSEQERITFKQIERKEDYNFINTFLSDKGLMVISPVIVDQRSAKESSDCVDVFCFVKKPIEPCLPPVAKINGCDVKIYHPSQKFCIICKIHGHQAFTQKCPAYEENSEETIEAFQGHEHPFSNFFPCKISVFQQCFESSEQAYQWLKATQLGYEEAADRILKCRHAGEAKRIARDVKVENCAIWEKIRVKAMRDILEAKMKTCDTFKRALLSSGNKILAEATDNKFWATGLFPAQTLKTKHTYWPGKNTLGLLLTELREKLQKLASYVPPDPVVSDNNMDCPYTYTSPQQHDYHQGEERASDKWFENQYEETTENNPKPYESNIGGQEGNAGKSEDPSQYYYQYPPGMMIPGYYCHPYFYPLQMPVKGGQQAVQPPPNMLPPGFPMARPPFTPPAHTGQDSPYVSEPYYDGNDDYRNGLGDMSLVETAESKTCVQPTTARDGYREDSYTDNMEGVSGDSHRGQAEAIDTNNAANGADVISLDASGVADTQRDTTNDNPDVYINEGDKIHHAHNATNRNERYVRIENDSVTVSIPVNMERNGDSATYRNNTPIIPRFEKLKNQSKPQSYSEFSNKNRSEQEGHQPYRGAQERPNQWNNRSYNTRRSFGKGNTRHPKYQDGHHQNAQINQNRYNEKHYDRQDNQRDSQASKHERKQQSKNGRISETSDSFRRKDGAHAYKQQVKHDYSREDKDRKNYQDGRLPAKDCIEAKSNDETAESLQCKGQMTESKGDPQASYSKKDDVNSRDELGYSNQKGSHDVRYKNQKSDRVTERKETAKESTHYRTKVPYNRHKDPYYERQDNQRDSQASKHERIQHSKNGRISETSDSFQRKDDAHAYEQQVKHDYSREDKDWKNDKDNKIPAKDCIEAKSNDKETAESLQCKDHKGQMTETKGNPQTSYSKKDDVNSRDEPGYSNQKGNHDVRYKSQKSDSVTERKETANDSTQYRTKVPYNRHKDKGNNRKTIHKSKDQTGHHSQDYKDKEQGQSSGDGHTKGAEETNKHDNEKIDTKNA